MENFPSFGTMVSFDLALLVVSLIATGAMMRSWRRIRLARAGLGVALIVLGIWVTTSLYLADFYAMIILPNRIGADAAMDVMADIHNRYSWYVNAAAAFLVVGGLLILIQQVLRQFDVKAGLLAEAAQRERRFNHAAQLAKLGHYVFDLKEMRVIFCTEQHAGSHGLSVGEYLRRASSLDDDLPLIHEDDRAEVRRKYERVAAGETVEVEYRVPTPDGERRVREIATPVLDENGQVVRKIGTSQDVTQQREIESQLHQSIKMEAIGNLTGGVAHDFNNLLAVILGNLELLKEVPDDTDNLLEEAIDAVLKGADLTKSMLSFARRAPLEPTVLDLNKIVLETNNWSTRALPSTIEVETSLLAGLWPIRADRASTESALLNLILNARDAMPLGGKLTIETANVRLDSEYIGVHSEDLELGRYVMLAVSDTGSGIPKSTIEKIFDPFFTTKPTGKGSGLGLSMIQGFMKQSGGSVQVYSENGQGTTFKLYFRAVDPDEARAAPAPDSSIAELRPVKSTVILVAEDQPGVMSFLIRTLEAAGYGVLPAASGDIALELYHAANQVDLVLTDIVMPGKVQGPELVRQLRQGEKTLPAVFMSGYAHEATVHGNGLRPDDIRLMKPVSRADLIKAIEQALGRG